MLSFSQNKSLLNIQSTSKKQPIAKDKTKSTSTLLRINLHLHTLLPNNLHLNLHYHRLSSVVNVERETGLQLSFAEGVGRFKKALFSLVVVLVRTIFEISGCEWQLGFR